MLERRDHAAPHHKKVSLGARQRERVAGPRTLDKVHHRLTRARVAALAEQALEGAAHFLVSGWLDYAVPLSALEIDANAPVVERGKRECGHPRPMASVARGGLPFQAPSTRRRLVRAPVRRRSANGFERTFDRNGQATRERKKR